MSRFFNLTSLDFMSYLYSILSFDDSGSCITSLQYMNSLNYLSSEAFSSIPKELVPDLQRMLSSNESTRPTAIDFTGKVVR